MATGGEEFGDKTPLMEKTDDQDDGDAGPGGDQTTEFEPGASSTPAPNGTQRQTTMNRPGEELSFPDVLGMSTTDAAMNVVVKEFPFVEKTRVLAFIEDGRVKVAFINYKGKAEKAYHLFSRIPKTNEYKINEEVKKKVKLSNALGKGRRETIQEKTKILSDGINENKKIIDDPFENQTEKIKARERMGRQIQEKTALEREFDQLKKGKYSIPSEYIELQTFQKNDEVRREIEQEKQREEEEQDRIIDDENSSPAQKERANERKNEIVREKMR